MQGAARPRARPTRHEAEEAVRTLLAWSGDDPDREGLHDTPKRVVEAYEEYFRGYGQDPIEILREATMEDVGGYDDIVLLKRIPVTSFCEHHIAPFTGRASVAYLPGKHVVGLSRLARVVEVYACRLQTQEALIAQIAGAIEKAIAARGVAVIIEAEHQCISARGLRQPGMSAVTTRFLGAFATDASLRDRFMMLVRE